MAITLTRQKDGSMKSSYSGMDEVMHVAKFVGGGIGKVARVAASLPGRYVDAVISANKRVDAAQKAKTQKDIERAFGSVENYKRINGLMP